MTDKIRAYSTSKPVFIRHLIRVLASVACASVLLVASSHASAQERFGARGQFAITAEDLFGFNSESWTVHTNGADVGSTTNRFSLLFNTGSTSTPGVPGGQGGFASFAVPKLGLHYFIIPSLSLGGSIGFETRSGSDTGPRAGVQTTTERGNGTTFMFQPKVGYALMLTDILGFWFRGGLGVGTDTERNAANSQVRASYTFWLFSAEALFVVTPIPHVGFYVGPGFDLSFAGSYSATTQAGNGPVTTVSYDASYHRLFIGAGMLAYF